MAKSATDYVALLRAVNVGGKTLAMSTLRDFASGLGLDAAKTLLQSGNLIFSGAGKTAAAYEALLESKAPNHLGMAVECLVRSGPELEATIAANPLPQAAKQDPAHLVVVFLKDKPSAGAVATLAAAIKGRESIKAVGRQLYVVYPDGIGRSKLTMSVIEKNLETRGTGRNWNTVLKLAALMSR